MCLPPATLRYRRTVDRRDDPAPSHDPSPAASRKLKRTNAAPAGIHWKRPTRDRRSTRGPALRPNRHWKGAHSNMVQILRCGPAHQPETDIVVTVVRMVVVAIGCARVVLIVVPRTAAHHAPRRLPGRPGCGRPHPPMILARSPIFGHLILCSASHHKMFGVGTEVSPPGIAVEIATTNRASPPFQRAAKFATPASPAGVLRYRSHAARDQSDRDGGRRTSRKPT
jgi:hypothetical protein